MPQTRFDLKNFSRSSFTVPFKASRLSVGFSRVFDLVWMLMSVVITIIPTVLYASLFFCDCGVDFVA